MTTGEQHVDINEAIARSMELTENLAERRQEIVVALGSFAEKQTPVVVWGVPDSAFSVPETGVGRLWADATDPEHHAYVGVVGKVGHENLDGDVTFMLHDVQNPSRGLEFALDGFVRIYPLMI